MLLDDQSIQIIKDSQQHSIDAKTLVEKQLELIYKKKWFNVWVPKEYGGLGSTLDEGLALLEELAYQDGGLAWTVTLCSGANMFAGFIDPTTAKKIFEDPKVCFGGSGRANGRATWNGKQYVIAGKWSFASGAPHLSHFTLNAPIFDGEVQRLDDDGKPVICSFFVPRDQVLVHYDWDTFGLECTASHSFSIAEAILTPEYCFELKPESRHYDNALYRIPFMTFAELTLLINYLGMYRRFLDLVQKSFFDRAKDPYWCENYSKQRFKMIDKLQQELQNDFQPFVRTSTNKIWELSTSDALKDDDQLLQEISATAKRIAKSIRMHVAEIMPLVGIQAAQKQEELNIVFRNIFTATQHSLLNAR